MNPVPPYAGQSQPTRLYIPARIAYQQPPYGAEEGPWVMPPYAQIYPPTAPAPVSAFVPPRLIKTDLFSAQQTWPL
jgi:hypothetical protein